MNSNISRISEVMEDIKQDITDNQYKIIMESLMTINKDPNLKLITIEFPIGTMSSSITQYQIIEDVPLVEGIILLDNNFITINDNIYYFKQNYC